MKRLEVRDQDACMSCSACELACSEAYYKTYDMRKTAIRVGYEGDTLKTFVCTQCGKCAEVCEVEAITQNPKGVYMINKKKCVSCGKCVEACPYAIVVMAKDRPAPSKCIACGICVKACPVDVLVISEA